MVRKQRRNFILIIFPIIGLIIVAIMMGIFFLELNDYNVHADEIEDLEDVADWSERTGYISRYINLTSGEVAILVDLFSEGLHLVEIDPEAGEITNSYPLDSNIFEDSYISYGSNGITLALIGPDNRLNLYTYSYGNAPELIEHEPFYTGSFLFQEAVEFDNTLYFVGQNETEEYMALWVKDGQVSTINFSHMGNIQNLTDIGIYDNMSYEINYPVVHIEDYEGNDYYYDLYQNTGELKTYSDNPPFWEIDDDLISAIADPEIILEDADDAAVAANIFYPEMAFLNENTVLIVGQNTVSENSGTSAYVVDGTGQNTIASFPQSELGKGIDDTQYFQAFLYNNLVYTSSEIGSSSASLNAGTVDSFGIDDFKLVAANRAETLEAQGSEFSLSKIQSFLQDSPGAITLLVNSVVFFLTFVIVPLLIPAFSGRRSKRRQKRIDQAYANGGRVVPATIVSMERTGLIINDDPEVRISFSFNFNGVNMVKEEKAIVSLINSPRVGEEVEVLYDPVRDRVLDTQA